MDTGNIFFYSKPEIKWNWIGAFWAGKGLIWQIKGRLSMGSRRVKTNGKRMVWGSLKHSIHASLCPKPYCGQKGKFLGYLRTSPGKSHARSGIFFNFFYMTTSLRVQLLNIQTVMQSWKTGLKYIASRLCSEGKFNWMQFCRQVYLAKMLNLLHGC